MTASDWMCKQGARMAFSSGAAATAQENGLAGSPHTAPAAAAAATPPPAAAAPPATTKEDQRWARDC